MRLKLTLLIPCICTAIMSVLVMAQQAPIGTYDLTAPFGGALYQTYNEKGVVVKAGETLRMKTRHGASQD